MLTGIALVAALGAVAGGAFALLLALPPAAAATTWGASAALGALGTRVAGAMARARAGPPRAGLPGRLEALAFAAPLVYFALR